MLKVGEKAPLFAADSTKGQIDLRKYLGKNPIVLIFYPMDQTPSCTKQLCAVRDAKPQYNKLNTIVIGINEAKLEKHEAFASKHHYDFPLVHDENGLIKRLYEVEDSILGLFGQKRTVFVIGKDGLIHYCRNGTPSTEEIMEAIRHSDTFKHKA